MSFGSPHKKYADLVMEVEAYKLLKKHGARMPSNLTGQLKSAESGSYDHTNKTAFKSRSDWNKIHKKYGKGVEPGGQYTRATAKAVNSIIKTEANKAVASAYKAWLATRKKASLDMNDPSAMAAFLAFAKTTESNPPSAGFSRRGLLTGFAVLSAAAFFPSEAAAEDQPYLGAVKRGVQSHVKTKAPAIVDSVGAGIRADLKSDKPKFVMQG